MKSLPEKYFNKIKKGITYFVTSLVIFTFLWMPFDNTFMANKIAYAQSGQYITGQTNFSSQNGPGIKGYIKGLAPAIAQLPQCKAIIKGKIKSLFKNVKGVVTKIAGKKIQDKVSQKIKEKTAEQTSIQTFSPNEYETARADYEKQVEIAEAQARQLENELCLKSIGKLVAKMLIQKITLSTITWIQSGYEGKPFFLQNPGKFFGDIAKNEILQFGGEITDPNLYPFGVAFMQNVVTAYNDRFQENARYSLNELIQQTTPEYSGASFSADFSAGGWNAWTSLTAVPANNPLGFQLMASSELAKRLDGTDKSTAVKLKEDLDRANGFLGQEQCADPDTGITRAQHDAALEIGQKEYDIDGKPTGYIKGTCRRWEYVTPGKMVADWAQEYVPNYQKDALVNIDDLNGAVAAILDAVLAQFSSKIQEGFVKVTNEGSDGTLILSTYNSDGNYETSQTEKDFAPTQLNSRWLEENPDFNIRTDITQALIDEQRIYSQKLEEQNLEIPQLIMDIRQLDYCIPGPNPNYETTSSVENFYDNINVRVNLKGFDIASTILDIALPLGGSALSSVVGFDPTQILSGVAQAILDDKREKKIKAIFASYIGDLFGVHIYGAGWKDGIDGNGFGDKGNQDQVLDEGDLRNLVENTWSSYADVIYRVYFNGAKSMAAKAGAMPTVTAEARNEFERIDSYQKMAEDNYDVIQTKKSVVSRLSAIKDAVEALGPAPVPGDPDYDAYEAALKDPIAEFSRISNDMVSGDDIAEVDNVLKELKDRRNYVWDDLLKGPGGCEEELEDFHNSHPLEYSRYVRRQPYPLPVYYFYGTVAGGPDDGPDKQDGFDYRDAYEWDDQIPWDKEYLRDSSVFTPIEGFLYGVVYYNGWAGPSVNINNPESKPEDDYDDDGVANNADDDDDEDGVPDVSDPDPYDFFVPVPNATPNTGPGRTDLCPEYIQFPEDPTGAYVEISLPSGKDSNNKDIDLGGLEPKGYGNGNKNENGKDYRNVCGVIPRLFEKEFNIY